MKSNKDLYKTTFQNVVPSTGFKEKILISSKNPSKSHKPIKKMTICVVAAIIICLSAVSVYAGMNMYRFYFKENGKYSNTMILEKFDNLDSTITLNKTHKVHQPEYVKLNLEYLTEGLQVVPHTDNAKYSFNNRNTGGISFFLYNCSNCDDFIETNTDVIDSEAKCINGNDVIYIEKKVYSEYTEDNPTWNKKFYIYFSDYDYILCGFVGTDISKNELFKIIQKISIEESDEENAFIGIFSEMPDIEKAEYYKNKQSDEDNTIEYTYPILDYLYYQNCKIGEKIPINENLLLTVEDLEISDNLDMMNDDFKREYLDDSGKIIPLEVKCYGGGDGINSLDKLQETKYIKLKYIYETLTYTNTSDNDIDDLCVYHNLMHKDGSSVVSNIEKLNDKYSLISYDESYKYALTEWVYADFCKESSNTPNSIRVQKNSSVTIHIGFFVPDDEITDDLYVSISEANRLLKIEK